MRTPPPRRSRRELLAELDALMQGTTPEPPPARRSGIGGAGQGLGGFRDMTESLPRREEPWSSEQLGAPRLGEDGARVLPDVTTTAPNPAGRGLASAIAYRFDQPRRIRALDDAGMGDGQELDEASQRTFRRLSAPGEFEGGLNAAADAPLEMAGAAVVPDMWPVQGLRRSLEESLNEKVAKRAAEVAAGGGDPSSNRFAAGLLAGGLVPAALLSGYGIAGAAAGLARGGVALSRLGGTGRAADAVRRAGQFVASSPRLTAYGASAGLAAATTNEETPTLFGMLAPEQARSLGMETGRGAAVVEDLALNAAGDGLLGGVRVGLRSANEVARRVADIARGGAGDGAARGIDAAFGDLARESASRAPTPEEVARGQAVSALTAPQGLPPSRRLPSATTASGVVDAPNDPNGRILITPPPREVSEGAFPVLTDQEAADRVGELRESLDRLKRDTGVDLITGQRTDPTRQAVDDFWRGTADAQNQRAAEEAAAADAADAATNPRRMSLRELLRENASRGIGYGVAGVAGAEALRAVDEDEQVDGGPLAATLGIAGLLSGGRRRKASGELSVKLRTAMERYGMEGPKAEAKRQAIAAMATQNATEGVALLNRARSVLTQEAQSVGRYGYVQLPGSVAPEVASPAMRRLNERVQLALTNEDGTSRVAQVVERLVPNTRVLRESGGTGVYESAFGPNRIIEMEATDEAMRLTAALHGLVEGQDAEAWHRFIGASSDTPEGLRQPDKFGIVLMPKAGGAFSDADIQRIVDAGVANATVADGHILARNFDGNTTEADFERGIVAALDAAGIDADIGRGYFAGEYLDGPAAYLRSLGRNPDAIREARRLLESVRPAYEAFAAEVGASQSQVAARLRERLDGLKALERQQRRPAVKTNRSGSTVADAMQRSAARVRERFGQSNSDLDPEDWKGRGRMLAERMKGEIDNVIREMDMDISEVRDWYEGGTKAMRQIATLVLPSLRDDSKFTIFTAISSVLSSGQKVPAEVRAAMNIWSQYERSGFSPDALSMFRVDGSDVDPKFTRQYVTGARSARAMSGVAAEGLSMPSGYGATESLAFSTRATNFEAFFVDLRSAIRQHGEAKVAQALREGTFTYRPKKGPDAGKIIQVPAPIGTMGPKIGQYFLDKLGLGGSGSTIDLWMARMYHLMNGDAPTRAPTADEIEKARKKLAKRNAGSDEDALDADEVAELQEVLSGNIPDDTVTEPMRREMQEALRVLAEEYDAKPSSMQALAWYAVKRMLSKAGAAEDALAYATLPEGAALAASQPQVVAPRKVDKDASPGKQWGQSQGVTVMGSRAFDPRDETLPEPLVEGWKAGEDRYDIFKEVGVPIPERPVPTRRLGATLAAVGALAAPAVAEAQGNGSASEGGADVSLLGMLGGAAGLGVLGAGLRRLRASRAASQALGPVRPPQVPAGNPASSPSVRTASQPAPAISLPFTPTQRDVQRRVGANADADPANVVLSGKPDRTDPASMREYEASHFRLDKVRLDPTGEAKLREVAQRSIAGAGMNPKPTVTWDDVRADAQRAGVDPDRLIATARKRNWTPGEALAGRTVIAENSQLLADIEQRLASQQLPADEVQRLEALRDAVGEQTENLVTAYSGERSAAGRLLNSFKILAHATMDPAVWLGRAQRVSRGTLTAQQVADVQGFIQRQDRIGLATYVAGLRKPAPGEFLGAFVKAGLLWWPKTHVVNLFSNALQAGMETAKDAPAALVDRGLRAIVGLIDPDKAGARRTKDFDPIETVAASWRGARRGVDEAKRILRDGTPANLAARWDQPGEVRTGNPVLDLYVNGPFRLLSAGDKPFREAAIERSIAEQQRVLGTKAVTDDMIITAIADAERATFQQRTALGSFLSRGKRGAQEVAAKGGVVGEAAGTLATETTMPFTKTPTAILATAMEYAGGALATPNDLARLLTAASKGLNDPAQRAAVEALQKRAAERLGRQAVGALALGTGWLLYEAGNFETPVPFGDAAGRDRRELTGGFNEGNLVIGNYAGSVDRISPIGNLIVAGAMMAERARDPEANALEAYGGGLWAMGTTMLESTMLRGFGEVRDATQREDGLDKLAEAKAQTVLPGGSILRGVSRLTDPVVRESDDPIQRLQSNVPGLSTRAPARLDALGQPVERIGGALGVVNELLSPVTLRRRRTDDPLRREIAETGAEISKPKREKAKGETAEAFRLRRQKTGEALDAALRRLMTIEAYSGLPVEGRRDQLERAERNTKTRVTSILRREASTP